MGAAGFQRSGVYDAQTIGGLTVSFVITGATRGRLDQPWFRRSADGERWEPYEVRGVPSSSADQIQVLDTATEGDDLVALVRTASTTRAGTTFVRQPVG